MIDNPIILGVGLGAYVLISAWLLSNWHVRSARAVGLLVAALVLVIAATLVIGGPMGRLMGLAGAVVVASPVIVGSTWIMPLARPDAEMSQRVADLQSRLVRAGRRLIAGEVSDAEYVRELESVRAALREIAPPDQEWRDLVSRLDQELANTIANAVGTAAHTDLREQRAAIQHLHTRLIKSRLRFWR